jgi:hypothetical protein
MLRIFTTLILFVALSISSLASSTPRNTEQLKELLNKCDLVIVGSLTEAKSIAKFHDSAILTQSKPPSGIHSVVYVGSVSRERTLIFDQNVEIPDNLSVVWFGYRIPEKDYTDQLASSFCPPISLAAYSKHKRIWFLKYDHGILRLVSDQPLDLESHITEYFRTGKAKTLDMEFMKWLGNQNEDDPFTD